MYVTQIYLTEIAKLHQVATGDFYQVYGNVLNLLNDQLKKFTEAVAQQRTMVAHYIIVPVFAPLIGTVITTARDKLASEPSRSGHRDIQRVCTGLFTRTMGLPCTHQFKEWAASNTSVAASSIHQPWFYIPYAAVAPLVLNDLPHLLNPLPRLSKRFQILWCSKVWFRTFKY